MSEGDVQQVINALRGTLSKDNATRTQSSEALVQFANVDGYLGMLLTLVHSDDVEESLRISAASQFKFTVRGRWTLVAGVRESEKFLPISEEEKASLRGNILGALVTKLVPVRNLLEDALRTIVSIDYPSLWPTLPDEILGALGTDISEQIVAGLAALRCVICRYDTSDNIGENRVSMINVMDATFPTLKALFEYALQHGDSSDAQDIQRSILRVVWDGTMYDLPQHWLEAESFDAWMRMLVAVVTQPVPVTPDMDRTVVEKLLWWQSKKWALHFFTRLVNRFMRPSAARKSDTPEFREFFAATYPGLFLECSFQILSEFAQGAQWPGFVTTVLLDFLNTALALGQLWSTIKPHVWDMIKGVFVPLLSFNEEDLQIFEYEPDLYIANQLDPIRDDEDPRGGALSFLYTLAKHRDPIWLQDIMAYLNTEIFMPYTQAGTQEQREGMMPVKYAGLSIVGSLSELLREEPEYVSTIEEMLATFVTPDMYQGPAWMRAKACWTFSRFVRIQFSDTANLIYGLEGLLKNLLEGEELPLVADAAVALFDLIPLASVRPILGPLVPELVGKFLSLMERVDNDAIVGSLQYLMRYFPGPVRKAAVELIHHLASAFLRADKTSNMIVPGDDTDTDNAYMAASQTIKAIRTLYKSIRKSPALYASMEPFLIPVLERIFSKDGINYIEEGLALMTEVTYHQPPPYSPNMWGIFDRLAVVYVSWAPDYMQNMLPSFDNFISRDKECFLAPGSHYLETVCNFASKFFPDPKYPELDLLPLIRLYEVILLECIGHVDHIIEPLLKLTIDRLLLIPNSIPMKVTLLELVLNCLYYNAGMTVHLLEQFQCTADVFKLMFELIVSDAFERVYDKKTASLGIGSLLRLPMEQLPPYIQEKFLEVVVTYLQLTQRTEEQRISQMEEEEDEFDMDEYDEEEGMEEEEEEEDWAEKLYDSEDDDDDSLEDENQLLEAIAMMKQAAAEEEEEEDLTNDDYDALAGHTRQRADHEDLPDAYGPLGEMTEEFLDRATGGGWTLTGQQVSTELPTENLNETIFLAETLESLDPNVKSQLFSSFSPELMELYNHLMQVAQDKAEKEQFEAQKKAAKEAEKAELQAYYATLKQQQQ